GALALLAAARSGALPGSWRLLAEALRVPPGLERAVEAALGPYVDAVVAEDLDRAFQALAWLRERGETAIVFAPAGEQPGLLPGSLAEQVGAEGAAAAVARALLGDVLLCEVLPAHPAPPGDARLWVTAAGEWRAASGGLSGGAEAPERTVAAAQARRRAIRRLDGGG